MRLSQVLLGAKKLVALNSKRGNKNYYKGRGAPSIGTRLHNGRYMIDKEKLWGVTFIAPGLKDFKLKAYVAPNTPKLEVNQSETRLEPTEQVNP